MHEAGMTDGSRLALVAAVYLSKFDAAALARLGYSTFKEAFADIGQKLGVNPRSVKNKRRFRSGFQQRPCRLAPEGAGPQSSEGHASVE